MGHSHSSFSYQYQEINLSESYTQTLHSKSTNNYDFSFSKNISNINIIKKTNRILEDKEIQATEYFVEKNSFIKESQIKQNKIDISFFKCNSARKKWKEYPITLNDEYNLKFSPLKSLKISSCFIDNISNSKINQIENTKCEIKLEEELRRIDNLQNMNFLEMLQFFEIKPKNWMNEIEIVDIIYPQKLNFNKNQFQFKCSYYNQFIRIKVNEIDPFCSFEGLSEKQTIENLIIEKTIQNIIKEVSGPFICKLKDYAVVIKEINPVKNKKYSICEITEYGRCTLSDLLEQRHFKGQEYFYLEKHLVYHLIYLLRLLKELHFNGFFHHNISTDTLILSNDSKVFKLAGFSNSLIIYNEKIYKRTPNLLSLDFLAPEQKETFPNSNTSELNLLYSCDIYNLGLVILMMMGVAKPLVFNFQKEKLQILNQIILKYPNLKKILELMLIEDPVHRPTAENLLEKASLLESEEPINEELLFLKLYQEKLNSYLANLEYSVKLSEDKIKIFPLLNLNEKGILVEKQILKIKMEHNLQKESIIENLLQIGALEYSKQNFEDSLINFMEALGIAQNSARNTIMINFYVSQTYFQLGQIDKSIQHAKKSIQLISEKKERNDFLVSELQGWLGSLYSILFANNTQDKNNFMDIALEYYKNSLEIRKKFEAYILISLSHCDIADLLLLNLDFTNAIINYDKALNIKLKYFGKVNEEVARIYFNVGFIYEETGNYDRAIENYLKSYEIYKSLNIRQSILADILLKIGGCYNNKKDKMNSHFYNKSALELIAKIGSKDQELQTKSLISLASFHLIDEKYDETLQQCNQILTRLDENENLLYRARCENILSLVYLKTSNIKKADEHAQTALHLFLENFAISHPIELSNIYNNIGLIKEKCNEMEEALDNFLKSKEIKIKFLEINDKEIKITEENVDRIQVKEEDHPDELTINESIFEVKRKEKIRVHNN